MLIAIVLSLAVFWAVVVIAAVRSAANEDHMAYHADKFPDERPPHVL